jgi:endonuclease YncB( thermonuclease family)
MAKCHDSAVHAALAVVVSMALVTAAQARSAKKQETAQPAAATVAKRELLAVKPEVVDGDSIMIGGVEWRLVGFDTPEINSALCEGERRAGLFAKRRLEEIVRAGRHLETATDGALDRYKRPLGDLIVDGRNVRDIMLEEGFARPYNGGRKKGWCSRDSIDTLIPGLPPARDRKKELP